jgi:predicted RND superfamily exporter protein
MSPTPPDRPKLGARHRLLLALERFSRGHYGVVFAIALVLAVAGGWLGSRLEIESDILDLIPRGNRQVDGFKDAVAHFGSASDLVVLLEAGPGEGPDELEEFADKFAERLEALESLVDAVEYRVDPGEDFLDLFYDNALLYLPPERLDELRARLTDEAIRRRVAENRLSLSSPTSTFTQDLMVNDPLDLMPLLFKPAAGSLGHLKVDLTDGYYLAADGQALIMLVKPTGAWQDLDFDRRLMEALRAAEARVREMREVGEPRIDSKVRYTGRYAIAVEEAGSVRQDIRFNLLFSLAAVSALYWICYRRFAALLYSSVPLLVGQALTFGLAFFFLRSLNASSSAFTALLMGLGTDFVIVMYARYVEERRLGRTLGQATELMVGETGLGVFTGAITSAGTFYAMCISEFRGLKDLGFLIGSGILVCAVAIVFLVPAMIKWNEGVRRRKVESVHKLYVQSFLVERLIPFSARHRAATIALVAGASLACAFVSFGGFFVDGWPALEFDDTIQVLRSNRSQAYKVQREMAQRFGASPSYMMVIVEAAGDDEALARTEQVEQRLQPFLESGVVSGHDSILSYVPPRSRQIEVLRARDAASADAFDPRRIRATFLDALEQNGFAAAPFELFLGRMERFLSPRRPIALEDLERRGLARLTERYVEREAGRTRIVTYLSTSEERWKREPPPGLVEDLTLGDENVIVTGTNIVSREFRRIFNREAPRAVLLGLAVVFGLLLVDFRSLKLTTIALSQLLSGVLLMLGAMKLLDIHLNYVNAFVATMILGVGIDYSIHLVHRMSLTGGRVEAGLLETGKAVVIAALTNIAAFGTLTLGNYPALRSFGKVALIGSLTCLATALTLVPAVMARKPESPER